MSVTLSGVYIPIPLLGETLIIFTRADKDTPKTVPLLIFQIRVFILGFFRCLLRENRKNARKSRGLELLADIENLDKMLCERHSANDKSANSNSPRRSESTTSDMFGYNEENLYLNYAEMRPGNCADPGQYSTSANSNVEINRLSRELNTRLSREMDEMMNRVNTQIQRAISDAISNHILPQIQNALRARSGHVTQNKWNVPAERPENNPEVYRSENTKSYFRSEPTRDCLYDSHTNQGYDTWAFL